MISPNAYPHVLQAFCIWVLGGPARQSMHQSHDRILLQCWSLSVISLDLSTAGKSASDFQAFMDGPPGPGLGMMNNNVFPVNLELSGGQTPYPRKFE